MCAFLLPNSGEAQSSLITPHGDKCFAIIIAQGRSTTYPCILICLSWKIKKKQNMKAMMKQGLNGVL